MWQKQQVRWRLTGLSLNYGSAVINCVNIESTSFLSLRSIEYEK